MTVSGDGAYGTTAARVDVRTGDFVNNSTGTSSVTVNNVAGNVVSNVNALISVSKVVNGGDALVASATGLVTSVNDVYGSLATSAVVIGTAGDVSSVAGNAGTGGSTVTVNGKVGTGGVSSSAISTVSLSRTVVDTDAGALITSSTVSSGTARLGGAATATIAAGASVAGGGVSATSDTAATVTIDGKVSAGNVNANAQTGAVSSNSSTNTATTSVQTNTAGFNPSTATMTIGSAAVIGNGDINVLSYSNSTFSNAGKIFNPAGATGDVLVSADGGFLVTKNNFNNSNPSVGNFVNTQDYAETNGLGGTASFTNSAGGYVGGAVTVLGPQGVTIVNNGQVAGATFGRAENTNFSFTYSDTLVTTATGSNQDQVYSQTFANTGGSVTGTYTGVNGEPNFAGGGVGASLPGPITQVANGASTATISGTVYGSVSSLAGTGGTYDYDYVYSYDTTTDGLLPPTGTTISKYDEVSAGKDNSGASTVMVSGTVSKQLGGGNVTSQGADSTLTISGAVQGTGTSSSIGDGVVEYTNKFGSGFTAANVAVAPIGTTSAANDYTDNVSKITGGAALGNVTGTGSVGGSLTVTGVASAASTVDAGAKVAGSLTVGTSGTDSSFVATNAYAYDAATKVATINSTSTSISGPAAASGNATATVAGAVGGSADCRQCLGHRQSRQCDRDGYRQGHRLGRQRQCQRLDCWHHHQDRIDHGLYLYARLPRRRAHFGWRSADPDGGRDDGDQHGDPRQGFGHGRYLGGAQGARRGQPGGRRQQRHRQCLGQRCWRGDDRGDHRFERWRQRHRDQHGAELGQHHDRHVWRQAGEHPGHHHHQCRHYRRDHQRWHDRWRCDGDRHHRSRR